MLLLLQVVVFSQPIKAQSTKSKPVKNRDFFKVKTPRIDYVAPDTSYLIKYEDFPEDTSDAARSIYFRPERELSIVSEDTSTLDEGEQTIVEISEEIQIDSVWIRIAGYYAIWDSRNINPYRMDPRQFRDTVEMDLIEPARNRLWQMPMTKNPITSNFGFRDYRWHYGTDLDLETGDTVRAVFDGVVRISRYDGGGYGNYVLVRHYNGLETLYGHFRKPLVKPGDFVKAGQAIGLGGSTGRSTGPHLHFEVRYQGNAFDPGHLYSFPDEKLRSTHFTLTPDVFRYTSRVGGRTYQARRSSYHKVRSGDTLSEIARKYHVPVAKLCKMNRITPRTTLKLGRSLRVR